MSLDEASLDIPRICPLKVDSGHIGRRLEESSRQRAFHRLALWGDGFGFKAQRRCNLWRLEAQTAGG